MSTSSNTIEKTLILKAPQGKVWHALTDHEAFGAWFRVRIDAPFVAENAPPASCACPATSM